MDTYIEVIGHAEVAETVVEQRATLTVTVKALKAEVAFDEATQLRNDVVRALKTAGFGRAPRRREPSVREDLTRIIVDRSGSWRASRLGNWPGRSLATKAALGC